MQHWNWRVIHRVYNVSIELLIELSIVSLAVNDIGAIMSVTRIEWSAAAKWFDAFPLLILEWHIYSQDDTVYLKLAMLNSRSFLNRLTPSKVISLNLLNHCISSKNHWHNYVSNENSLNQLTVFSTAWLAASPYTSCPMGWHRYSHSLNLSIKCFLESIFFKVGKLSLFPHHVVCLCQLANYLTIS